MSTALIVMAGGWIGTQLWVVWTFYSEMKKTPEMKYNEYLTFHK